MRYAIGQVNGRSSPQPRSSRNRPEDAREDVIVGCRDFWHYVSACHISTETEANIRKIIL